MKHLIWLLLLITIGGNSFCQNTEGYSISGTCVGCEGKKVLLSKECKHNTYYCDSAIRIDSCYVKNDSFKFSGALDEPDYYSIRIEGMYGYRAFILENDDLNMVIDTSSIYYSKLIKNKTNWIVDSLTVKFQPYVQRNNQLVQEILKADKSGDSVLIKSVEEQYKTVQDSILEYYIDFISRYPDHFESVVILRQRYKQLEEDKLIELLENLSPRLQNHSVLNDIKYALYEADSVLELPVSFSQMDTAGAFFNIESLRGQYVLIDFWGSWCKPCRAENPELRETYELFNPLGFEIVAVSLDSKRKNWINAIHSDSLNWIHLSGLKGFYDPIAKKYNVNFVPSNFLINPEGYIIASNLRQTDLRKKLGEIYQVDSVNDK